MAKNIKNSQVATGKGKITKSKNETSIDINKIKRDTIIISFIVGFLSSILASFIYTNYLL